MSSSSSKINGVASSANEPKRLEDDISALSDLLNRLGAANASTSPDEADVGGDDLTEMDERALQELLETIERAEDLADGVEGRVDALIENLESLLLGLDRDTADAPQDTAGSSERSGISNEKPVEEVDVQQEGEEPQGTRRE